MKSNSKILATLLAVVLVGALAVAQGMRPGHMREDGIFGGPMLGFFADYLDLSSAQQAQIKQIMAKEKPTMEPLWQQERQSHEAMKQLIMSGNFDEAKAQTIAKQAAQVQAQLMVATCSHRFAGLSGADSGAEDQAGPVHGQARATVRGAHEGTWGGLGAEPVIQLAGEGGGIGGAEGSLPRWVVARNDKERRVDLGHYSNSKRGRRYNRLRDGLRS